jgi:DNA repair photolyase
MPGINDDPAQVQPIVERAKEAGATFLGGVALHLKGEVKDVFFAWLQQKRPDLLPEYEALYGNRAYMRPEQRRHTTRAIKGWGRGRSFRSNASAQRASNASATRAGGVGAGDPEHPAQGSPDSPRRVPPAQAALF